MKLTSSRISSLTTNPHAYHVSVALIACGMLCVSIYVALLIMKPTSSQTNLLGTSSLSRSVTTSVSVGDYHFTLTGYTSPRAHVILEGQGLYEETVADTDGYFIFDNRFSPLSEREACLTAKDTDGRVTAPFCLPPFPIHKNVSIGPLIIPPSISLNQDTYALEDFGISTGKGVPDSIISILLASADQERPIELTTQTDMHGNYSMTLPTQKTQSYNLSAHNSYQKLHSTRSTSLSFSILPLWLIFIRFCQHMLYALRVIALPLLILIEALLLIYAYKHKSKDSSRQRVKQA